MRRRILTRVPHVAVVAVFYSVVLISTACKKDENRGAGDTTMSTMAATDSSLAKDTTQTASAATPQTAMTDAQIFAGLAAANQGEIAAGKMAESKATNADVKAFARMMVADHTRLLNDGNALAKRLKVIPDTDAADSIRNANQTMAEQLKGAPKGMTFDTTYVNGQVVGHGTTLDMIKNASGRAQNADLKKALNDAIPVVQHHLDRIKDIQGKLH